MKSKFAKLLLLFLLLLPWRAIGQNTGGGSIIQGNVTSREDKSPLVGVTVSEIDANNRVVGATMTDINGHYVLKIKNAENRLSFSYIGFNKQTRKIDGNTVLNASLEESVRTFATVEIKAQRKHAEGGFSIPQRQIATALQTIDAKEFEGLQVSSVDEALQGRIAGLDIVSNSGDPGSGTSMRIRGTTSINSSAEPLIVVNGVPYEVQIDANFDFANSNQEQYANMLSINPDDIESITVLKDAAASAIWGSKGANGVLMITTKKGAFGPTRIDYSYRFTRTEQPKGMKMLNGDEYTMLMKQSYFNPRQDRGATSDIDEFNYSPTFSEYQNFNNNTDWVNEVTQIGNINDHYLTLSGGGERAQFRVSGGYFTQNGTVIGQNLNRITSRAYLEYSVSSRLKFISEFSFTNSDNKMNYVQNYYSGNSGVGFDPNEDQSILAIAYKKMPNVGVYAQDVDGNNTGVYYNIPRSSGLNTDQRSLFNPVALAKLATNALKTFRILPIFRLQYDLLDPNKQMLRYGMYVSFDLNNNKTLRFLPQEASNFIWDDRSVNRSEYGFNEGLTIQTDNNITWQPSFANKDHSLLLYGSIQNTMGRSSAQGFATYGLASSDIPDASTDGYLESVSTSRFSWRSMGIMGRFHYAFKERYILSGTLRRDGSTKFGDGRKFGNFPGISGKWIISDEPFMKGTKKWLSTFSFRPGWGISGNQPKYEYLHYSRYGSFGSYVDMPATRPTTLRLNNLKWETTSSYNYGSDIGFKDDSYVFDLNWYHKRTKDLLFENRAVASTSGFGGLSYVNAGVMDNDGWEVNFYANKIIKTKSFSMDFKFNIANYVNTLVNLDKKILDGFNASFNYLNGSYLQRVQEDNSFGSIYGFRYKGVYQYDKYIPGTQENAPVSRDVNGNVNTDEKGEPMPMYFNFYGETGGLAYQFRGGDAIYEDINHDGNIDKLDIVYLGNTNPKLSGGFGPTFRYKNLSCNMFFNFRYGNKIVNRARMNAENMYGNDNQSKSVDWRWSKDGDVTDMPRALYQYGYNWLGSDRYVEDGSFLRFKYLTFNYAVPSKSLKKYHINKMSFYLTVNNLWVWTKYSGVDPEVGYGSLGTSFDDAKTPRSKDFTLGVSIGL